MYNDDFDKENEKEEESLIKDIAKKGISKIIKTKPSFNFIILFVGIGIVLLLLLITVISTLSIMFFFNDNDGASNGSGSNLVYIGTNSEDNFWWPIGGPEIEVLDGIEYATGNPTSITVTSEFSNRLLNGNQEYHNAIDIGSSGRETDYVIAASKGVVEYVSTGCNNNGNLNNTCGGGFGNYVKIRHAGGVYTIYAHLFPNSIRVSTGDVVNQGQILAEMGNSGRSTGKHLHFQVMVSNVAKNPRNYVSPDNPRPKTISSGSSSSEYNKSEIIKMLHSWEGTGPTEGDYYIVYDDGAGVLTVGHGVTLKWNKERFKKRNIDPDSLEEGSKIKKSIVDDIELEVFNEYKDDILNTLSKNSIVLNNYQIDALVMRRYNSTIGQYGSTNGSFVINYKIYGDTQELYDNYMKGPTTAGGKVLSGLVRRREAEWNLFHNGIYTFNS